MIVDCQSAQNNTFSTTLNLISTTVDIVENPANFILKYKIQLWYHGKITFQNLVYCSCIFVGSFRICMLYCLAGSKQTSSKDAPCSFIVAPNNTNRTVMGPHICNCARRNVYAPVMMFTKCSNFEKF